MGYHPRIEEPDLVNLVTTRTRNRELWLINNEDLEEAILAAAAKYSSRYSVRLYALGIEGNHIHSVAAFARGARCKFMRDFNSSVAKSVEKFVENYPGGGLWGRRYSNEFLPGEADIEDKFFYTVLQPVQDGLVERISDFPGYNCFHDAVWGISRKFKIVRWTDYHEAKRWNPRVHVKDFTEIVELKYERLPGYEHLDQRTYALLMERKLEDRRRQIVEERHKQGLFGFVGREALLRVRPGTPAKSQPSPEERWVRPRVISVCPLRRAEYLKWYYAMLDAYWEASRRYRSGDLNVRFPLGMFRPSLPPSG